MVRQDLSNNKQYYSSGTKYCGYRQQLVKPDSCHSIANRVIEKEKYGIANRVIEKKK